jgi:hypothetical protein
MIKEFPLPVIMRNEEISEKDIKTLFKTEQKIQERLVSINPLQVFCNGKKK